MFSRSVTTSAVVFALVLGAAGTSAQAQSYWYETYQRVVQLNEDARWDEAAPLIDQLLRQHPVSTFAVRLPGNQLMDYCPYYQRARVSFARGNPTAAMRDMDIAQAFGEVENCARERKALVEFRQRVALTLTRRGSPPELQPDDPAGRAAR